MNRRPSYLHLALLLVLASSTVTTIDAKSQQPQKRNHLRQGAAEEVTTRTRALLSIKQEQNQQQDNFPDEATDNSDTNADVDSEVDDAEDTADAEAVVGVPYTEMVYSTPQDRHSPALPDRIPHDPELKTISFKPSGNDSTDPGTSGSDDSSLGLPFLVVIGGSTLFVLTAVLVAAKKMRNKDDDEEEDADDSDGDDVVESSDIAKERAAAATGTVTKKSGLDFSSIVPGNNADAEGFVDEEDISHVSTEMVDSSMDTTQDDNVAAAPGPLLLDNDNEAKEETDDNALLLTI